MRRILKLAVLGAALGILVSEGFQPAFAENSARGVVDERLEALDQKVKVLERKWVLDQEAAAAKAKEAAIVGAGKDGFFLKSADGSYQLMIGGYVQADGRFYIEDNSASATDTFLLRRVYLVIDGILSKDFDFRITPDFGGGKAVIQDAYIGYKYSPEARLRVGRFKAPFGLEYLQVSTDTTFVEYALPTNLVPNRDLGIQLHGDLLGGIVSYAVGLFNGVSDGTNGDGDDNDGKDLVGRIFVQPFKNSEIGPLDGLGIGMAASQGERASSTALPTYKTSGQNKFFSYKSTVTASGSNNRCSPQAYYYWDSFGLLGEYVSSSQRVSNGTNKDIVNTAWQVVASYVLTREKATYKGVKPKGSLGAFELVGRYSELNIDDSAFASSAYADITKSVKSAKATGVGFNWYVKGDIKISADFEQTKFDGGASGNKDREDEKVILSRVQAVF